MSAEIKNLEDVVNPLSAVPAKRAPAKKAEPVTKPVAVRKTQEEIEDEIRTRIEAEYAEKFEAKIRAEMEAKLTGSAVTSYRDQEEVIDLDVLDEVPVRHVVAKEGEVVIHFVDDGATLGSRRFVRGEELAVNPEENPWVNETRAQQIRGRGKHLWAKGPWPYGGFDLTDPNLTQADKMRLVAESRKTN